MSGLQALLHACFKDSRGKIIIFQPPNIPLCVWFVCTIFAKVIHEPSVLHRLFEAIGFGVLFTWAWLEIFQGTTYFRRILGGIILILSIVSHIR
jgi:hypothetical protein